MDDKTTDEVLGIAASYLATCKSAAATQSVLADSGASTVKKLDAALTYCVHQRKPPAALVQWLTEALERERKAGIQRRRVGSVATQRAATATDEPACESCSVVLRAMERLIP